MRMFHLTACAMALLAACLTSSPEREPLGAGGHGSGSGSDDSGSGSGTSLGGEPDAGTVVANGNCTADASYGAAMLSAIGAFAGTADEVENMGWANEGVYGNLNSDEDVFEIDMYTGSGAFSTGIQTGAFTLTGVDLDPLHCGLCVEIYTNAGSDGNSYTDYYFATGGMVTLTTVGIAGTNEIITGGTIVGTATGLTFQNWGPNGQSGQTTGPVDSCTSTIDSVSFTATVTPNPNSDATADAVTTARRVHVVHSFTLGRVHFMRE